MYFNSARISTLISSHFDYIKSQDPEFLSNYTNHLRTLVITAARLLEKDRAIWSNPSLSKVRYIPQGFSVTNAIDMFTSLMDQAAMQSGFEVSAVEAMMRDPINKFAKYHETLDELIASAVERKINFGSFFSLLNLTKINADEFYVEMIAYYALNQFRRENGFVSLLGTGYTPSNREAGWDDYEIARRESKKLLNDPQPVGTVMGILGEQYSNYKNRIIVKF